MEEYLEEQRTRVEAKSIFTLGQAVLTIIGFIFLIGVTCGTSSLRISTNESEIEKLKILKEAEKQQLNRMEYNLRKLCAQQKVEYEDFGR